MQQHLVTSLGSRWYLDSAVECIFRFIQEYLKHTQRWELSWLSSEVLVRVLCHFGVQILVNIEDAKE